MTSIRSRRTIRLVLQALVVLVAVTSAAGAQGASLDGTWRSVGYGDVLTIVGDSLQSYEVTAISCVRTYHAHRSGAPGANGTPFQIDGTPSTFVVAAGSRPDERRLHRNGTASDIIIRRTSKIPERCAQPMAKDVATAFDVYWQTFREHYPFFAMRGLDWATMRDTYRPRAIAGGPTELFDALSAILDTLHDAHTFLNAPDLNRRYGGHRIDPEPLDQPTRLRAYEVVDTKYLLAKPRTWANGRVSFGMLPDSIGYLRISGFAGYVPNAGFAEALAALEAALDTTFADTRGWRGLIIDVRVNGGGSDPLGLAIAARLTDRSYLAYAKVARSDPNDPSAMTPKQPSMVRPSARRGWRGRVVELTSRYSISAAETFTQALMGRRPAIPRVGENTQGVFSDVLGRTLPNGWGFGLPNELFLDETGKGFDGPGIPPTVALPTMRRADIEAGRDPVLERAMAIVKG